MCTSSALESCSNDSAAVVIIVVGGDRYRQKHDDMQWNSDIDHNTAHVMIMCSMSSTHE